MLRIRAIRHMWGVANGLDNAGLYDTSCCKYFKNKNFKILQTNVFACYFVTLINNVV